MLWVRRRRGKYTVLGTRLTLQTVSGLIFKHLEQDSGCSTVPQCMCGHQHDPNQSKEHVSTWNTTERRSLYRLLIWVTVKYGSPKLGLPASGMESPAPFFITMPLDPGCPKEAPPDAKLFLEVTGSLSQGQPQKKKTQGQVGGLEIELELGWPSGIQRFFLRYLCMRARARVRVARATVRV